MSKTVLFKINQLCISTEFSSIWPIDRTFSGAPTQSQNGPRCDGIDGVLCISQTSSITGTSPSGCLVLYPGHSLGGVLLLCRGTVGVFYSPSWLGKWNQGGERVFLLWTDGKYVRYIDGDDKSRVEGINHDKGFDVTWIYIPMPRRIHKGQIKRTLYTH